MTQLYYIELNLACIIILLLIRGQGRRGSEQLSAARMVFNRMIWVTVVLCVADLLSGALRGQLFPGARIIIEISNMVFFETVVAIGYLWTLYVDCRLNGSVEASRKKRLLFSLPLIAFTVAVVTNPFTHFLFTIDANNLYARNIGVYFHWIVSWGYLLYPTICIFREFLREKNRLRRQEIHPLLYFIIAPLVASIAQMIFYGVSSLQLGITISIIMIFMAVQGNRILTDALTGLNNRRGLDNYLEDHIQRHEGEELSLLMIDVNHFKSINDKYGHMVGDQALKETAALLKQTCRIVPNRPFICRYGGDEFVAAGVGSKEELDRFVELLHEEFGKRSKEKLPCGLDISVGKATGRCSCIEDAENLLRVADEAMYAEKKLLPRSPK